MVKFAIAVAVLYMVGRGLRHYGLTLAGRLGHLRPVPFAEALAICIVCRLVTAAEWVLVVRALGQRVPLLAGSRLWLITETMRWLPPGGVVGWVSRAVQGKDVGVTPLVASLSAPLEILMLVSAWGATATAGVLLGGISHEWLSGWPMFWVLASAAALVATVGLAFALAQWRPSAGIARKLRGLQNGLKQLSDHPPNLQWMAITFVFMVALCFLQGLGFLAMLSATSASVPSFLAATSINAAGWLVGFFAFFAPSGIGVREGAVTTLLAPLMPLDAALVAVILWRVIQIFAEAFCLGVCYLPGVAALGRRGTSLARVDKPDGEGA
jgi:hypothetical protein